MSSVMSHVFRLRVFVASTVLALGTMWLVTPSAQQSGFPSTVNGEWPSYAGDLQSTHYSPLDQINASNFSKLDVAWRFKTDILGPRPEFKLEGTPLMVKGVLYTTGGTRRRTASSSLTPARASNNSGPRPSSPKTSSCRSSSARR